MIILRALIVDDEATGRENLKALLQEYCLSVQIAGIAGSASEARQMIRHNPADVIFMDINMPGEDGFSLLSSINSNLEVVFVTAYEQYAIKAIKYGAADYILKPVDIDELLRCERNLLKRRQDFLNLIQTNDTFPEAKDTRHKITIHHARGITIVDINDIIRLSSDDSYTNVYLRGERIVVSMTLKSFLESLQSPDFLRVHRSHAVNRNHIREYLREYGYILMNDGAQIEVSRRRTQEFFMHLENCFIDTRKGSR